MQALSFQIQRHHKEADPSDNQKKDHWKYHSKRKPDLVFLDKEKQIKNHFQDLDLIKMANEKRIFMGMTSQCIDGRVRMTVYESGRDLLNLGIIPLEDMIPEVALVKAMWVTGNTENYDEIKENMLNKIASEFST